MLSSALHLKMLHSDIHFIFPKCRMVNSSPHKTVALLVMHLHQGPQGTFFEKNAISVITNKFHLYSL